MKKFKLKGTNGRELTGFYLGVQLVASPALQYKTSDIGSNWMPLPKIVNEMDMFLIYMDEGNCIWTEVIHAGDEIEFL